MRKNPKRNNIFKFLFLALLALSSCKTIFKTSPYKAYVNNLQSMGLSSSVMGSAWISKGQLALNKPTQQVATPFKERVYFQDHLPEALGYIINYKKGRKLKFKVNTSAKVPFAVFIDLFEANGFKNISGSQSKDTTFYYEDNNDKNLILRLQPELLIAGSVNIEIIDEPKLGFPVSGGNNRSIQSFWGVDRDGGNRKHEGIDIFAKRGTPVLAVANGTVTRVQETAIGGKVVWQRLGLFNQSIYYAHLDSQLVNTGQELKKGEPVGLVGNTGNAKSTSPHLHFGIYTMGGAIDPLEYVLLGDTTPSNLKSVVKYLGSEILLQKSKTTVIPAVIMAVSSATVMYINEFGEKETVKDISLGKVPASLKISRTKYIYQQPDSLQTQIGEFSPKTKYAVLGIKDDFLYVSQLDVKGWVMKD